MAVGVDIAGSAAAVDAAIRRGECARWHIEVREHVTDGRVLVLAGMDPGTRNNQVASDCGEFVSADASDAEIISTIRRVGRDASLPDATIEEVIQELPTKDS